MSETSAEQMTEPLIVRLAEQPDVNFGPLSVYRKLVGGDRAPVPVFTGVQSCAPGYETRLHSHPYTELLFVVEGEAFVYLEGREHVRHRLTPGDMVALPPKIAHVFGNAGSGTLRLLGIHTSPERIVDFSDGTDTGRHGFVDYGGPPATGVQGAVDGPPVWRGMSEAQVHAQFNMRVAVPDADRFIAERAARSAPLRASLPGRRDERYGAGPRQTLDVYPAGDDGPIAVFFHGGAWRAGSKEGFAFVAEPLLAAGITAVVPGYDLIPQAGLLSMMAQAREAVAWVGRELAQGGRRRIVLVGHSAGAQLAGMALAHDFRAEGLARSPVSGALLISGSFDMEPHRHHARYRDMKLDEVLVQQVSPLRNPPLDPIDVVVAVGGAETPGYLRQADEYVQMLSARGHRSRVLVVPGDHHFAVVGRLGEHDHLLAVALRELAFGREIAS